MGGRAPRWRNWAGTASARPTRVETPADAAETAAVLARARREELAVRPVGSGHSFTPLAATDGVQLRLDRLSGLRWVDRTTGLARVGAGTTLRALADELAGHGTALPVLGDIDRQTVAGAVSTGTHGSGRTHASLAALVEELELALPDGTLTTATPTEHPRLFAAARLGLGAVGVLTELTLRVVPAFLLHADEGPASFEDVLGGFDALVDGAEHVDFHWFPFTDAVQLKRWNRTDGPARPLPPWRDRWEGLVVENLALSAVQRVLRAAPRGAPPVNRLAVHLLTRQEYVDRSDRVFTSRRLVHFVETEYAVPRSAAVPVLRALRELTEGGPWHPSFPVEVRTAPADDVWLSTAYGRDTVYVACHAYPRTDHRRWFAACEELFVSYGGRPHWGKLHTRDVDQLAAVCPRLDDVRAVRDAVDPGRLLSNAYVDRVLGP